MSSKVSLSLSPFTKGTSRPYLRAKVLLILSSAAHMSGCTGVYMHTLVGRMSAVPSLADFVYSVCVCVCVCSSKK